MTGSGPCPAKEQQQFTFKGSSYVDSLTNLDIEIDIDTTQAQVEEKIDKRFRFYAFVISTYLGIIAIEILGNSLGLYHSLNLTNSLSLAVRFIMLYAWFIGNEAVERKSVGLQIRFQGLLILFVLYHVVICGQIVLESYTTIPYFTYVCFGLNFIYGIGIPVIIYSIGDDLRRVFQKINNSD